MVAVELAHDVLAPAFDLSAARQVHDRAAVLHERGVQACDVEDRGRQVDEGDECVGASHGQDAGDVGDEGDVVDASYIIGPLSLRRCEPVNSPWSAQKKTAVSSRMPSSRATSMIAPDLEVDHGRVAPVDRDELLPTARSLNEDVDQ